MQLFDTASRGPLGSLFILLEHKGQSLVSLGALVIVLALIFDPFMQQLLRYPVREIEFVNSSSAAAPQTVVLLPEYLTADPRSIMYTGIWSEDFEYNGSSGFSEWGPSDIPETYGKPDNGAILKTPILDRIATVGLETVVQNIAASFTKAGLTSRTNATAAASAASANTATIRGTVRLTEIYVSVRWLWLVFPSALVALGLVFLGLTMLTNGRRGLRLWKSSILAILFHGLEGFMGEDEDEDDRFATDSRMDRAARGMEVSLEVVERRKGLVLNCSCVSYGLE
ncbi:hypothetical protein ASPCAL08210 [Aspergillus calidoustus]|uniref:Uncharacterized protein n=1 Tax=Aspergillus calidoustus TaxID=454130 RepID=A0A0U5GS45_ASPCI|nr:hypothetical protein ASPCAL08210 [Aspergillus calidoustus]